MKEIKCKECKHGWCSIHGKRFCTRVHDFKDEDDTCEKAEKKEEERRDEINRCRCTWKENQKKNA